MPQQSSIRSYSRAVALLGLVAMTAAAQETGPTTVVPATVVPATGVPATVVPNVRSANLQMMRSADQDSAQLSVELVARFADGQLLGWSDIQLLSVEGPDGARMSGQGSGATTLLQHGESEDDLSIPLSLELSGFTQPPASLKKLRISAIALIGHGATRELALPATASGRTFAPADDRKATVVAQADKDHWRLDLAAPLAQRCVKLLLRRADGSEEDSSVNQNQVSPQRTLLDLRPNSGDMTGTRPVLILVEKIERRAVLLSADRLDLFSGTADPELLPLGGDPQAPKARVVPAPDSDAIEVPPAK